MAYIQPEWRKAMPGAGILDRHMGRGEAVGLAATAVGAITVQFLVLNAIVPLAEPWRTIMGTAAFIAALLTVARYAMQMLGDKNRHEEIMDALKRNEAKLDALLAGQDEIIRLLRIIAEAVLRDKTVLLDKGGETTAGAGGGGGGDSK